MKIYLIPEWDTCRLFITFINDIASYSMAFSIACSVTYNRHTRDALHYASSMQGRRQRSGHGLTTFFALNGSSLTMFLGKYFLQGHFLTFPSRPLLMTFCDDQRLIILNDKPCSTS